MSLLKIQDSFFSRSYSLHEAILECAQGAISGGGAFAFVSKDALRFTLEDANFAEVISSFHFIAGIDQITRDDALLCLQELSEQNRGLRVNAFKHSSKNSLFHPKFCWFQYPIGGKLIVGSGNFTMRGLRINREAFTVLTLNNQEINEVKHHWELWLAESRECLKNVNDADVLERAKLNRRITYRVQDSQRDVTLDSAEIEDYSRESQNDNEGWFFTEHNEVLIAEIPKSGTRWKQANFDITTFQQFFGATPGDNSQRVLLRAVNGEGVLGEIESRPSVSVQSQNYRFELDAASGIPYPENGRPVGVFVKISPRVFLYILSLPGSAYHDALISILDRLVVDRLGQVRRLITTVQGSRIEIGLTPLSRFLI